MNTTHDDALKNKTPLLFATLFAITCLIIAYLLMWKRGFYYDDYEQKIIPVSFTAMRWNGARFLTSFMVTSLLKLIPDQEFLFRSITTSFAGINALLLGLISSRLTQTRLGGVIAAWLFLVPVWASEAVLWATPSVGYTLSTMFYLLYLYCAYMGLSGENRTRIWIILAIVAFFIALNFVEFIVSAILILPFLTLIIRFQTEQSWRNLLIKSGILIVVPGILTLIYFLAFYTNLETSFERQGSLILNPFDLWSHIHLNFLTPLYWRTIHPDFSLRYSFSALVKGLEIIFTSIQGISLVSLAVVCLLVFMKQWKQEKTRSSHRILILLIVMSLVWSLVSLLIPTALMSSQVLSIRLIYLPTAALCTGIAAIVVFLPAKVQRMSILVIGCLTISLSLIMLAYARAYAVRYSMDRDAISALNEIVPVNSLPPGTHIITTGIQHDIGPDKDDVFPHIQPGILENQGAIELGVALHFQRYDLDFLVSNRWANNRVDFSCTSPEILQAGDICVTGLNEPTLIADQGSFIVVSSREDVFFTVNALHFRFADETIVVDLPLAVFLAQRGTRLIDHIVIDVEG